MTDNLLKSYLIGLAAFLHDIGKAYQRTGNKLSNEFKNGSDNWQIFLNKDSHYHALHTGEFFEKYMNDTFIDSLWEECFDNISMQKVSAGHHNPTDFLTKIIADADQIASGFDRERYEERQNKGRKDYRRVHLAPLLRHITLQEKEINTNYRYPLEALNYDSIFPVNKNEVQNIKVEEKYQSLIDGFESDFEKIEKEQDIKIYSDALQSLFEKYFSFVPASTWDEYDEVSLFDHSKTTAAFATATFNYLQENSLTNLDNTEDRFIVIRGEFFGIQKFIFGNSSEVNKNSAKILRGKSFYVSMLSEITAQYFLEILDLPVFNLMLNAAGMFVIVAQNTKQAKDKINNLKEELNTWLYNEFFGEVSLGIVVQEAKTTDFSEKRFEKIWLDLLSKLDEEKYSKFNLTSKQALFKNFHQQFDSKNLCKSCGKRAASQEVCKYCETFEDLGKNLVNNRFIYLLKAENGEFFNKFKIEFKEKYESKANIFKVIDTFPSKTFAGAPILFLNNYVPKDLNKPKSFEEMVKNEKDVTKPLAVLKADIDNLGAIFACGLEPFKHEADMNYRLTFSRLSAMSRMLNMFFAYYLPYICSETYENIYTVFAGGDDLFLIGPYDQIIDFNLEVLEDFQRFTGNNNEITLSSSISLFKHNTPVSYMAEIAEDNLMKSKSKGKDSFDKGYLTILNSTVKYEKFLETEEEFNKIFNVKVEEIQSDSNRSFWYKILNFIDMKLDLMKETTNLNNIMWLPRLKYLMARTIKDKEIREKCTEFLFKKIESEPELLRSLITINLYNQRYGG